MLHRVLRQLKENLNLKVVFWHSMSFYFLQSAASCCIILQCTDWLSGLNDSLLPRRARGGVMKAVFCVGKNIMIEDMDEFEGKQMCWLWSWTEFLNGPDTAIKWTLGVYFCPLVQVTLEAAGICHTKQICHVYLSTRNIFVKAELFYQLFASSCFPREITGQIH